MFGLLYWIFVVNLPIKQWQFPNSILKECWSFNVAVAFFGKCLALNPNFRNSIKSSSGQESQWQILHKFYWGDGAKEGTARKSGSRGPMRSQCGVTWQPGSYSRWEWHCSETCNPSPLLFFASPSTLSSIYFQKCRNNLFDLSNLVWKSNFNRIVIQRMIKL